MFVFVFVSSQHLSKIANKIYFNHDDKDNDDDDGNDDGKSEVIFHKLENSIESSGNQW